MTIMVTIIIIADSISSTTISMGLAEVIDQQAPTEALCTSSAPLAERRQISIYISIHCSLLGAISRLKDLVCVQRTTRKVESRWMQLDSAGLTDGFRDFTNLACHKDDWALPLNDALLQSWWMCVFCYGQRQNYYKQTTDFNPIVRWWLVELIAATFRPINGALWGLAHTHT